MKEYKWYHVNGVGGKAYVLQLYKNIYVYSQILEGNTSDYWGVWIIFYFYPPPVYKQQLNCFCNLKIDLF